MHIPFRPVARLLTRTLHPDPIFDLSAVAPVFKEIEQRKEWPGMLIMNNHYSAPDFQAWWYVIPISAIFPADIHWLVTSGWTNSGWLTGFTHWLFPRGARLFGFTAMPAMPPNPAETEQRAMAVREVLSYASRDPHPVIGITPEGRDQPAGALGELPPGVGRFIQLISKYCPLILPAGVWTEAGCIHIVFGNPYQLEIPPGLPAAERDSLVGTEIMQRIAELIPRRLRGKYN
jgi:hypothetical protein